MNTQVAHIPLFQLVREEAEAEDMREQDEHANKSGGEEEIHLIDADNAYVNDRRADELWEVQKLRHIKQPIFVHFLSSNSNFL